MSRQVVAWCLFLLFLSGCGALFRDNPNSAQDSTQADTAIADYPQVSPPPPAPTGQVLVLYSQPGSALATDVFRLRFSGTDLAGQLAWGPEVRTVSAQNVLKAGPRSRGREAAVRKV